MSRLALVGCGRWGKNLARVFHQLGSLATVVDSSPTAAQRLLDGLNDSFPHASLPAIRSFQDVLHDPAIHAVVLATPAASHISFADQALRHGKDVLVEKPVAFQTRQLLPLIQRAEDNELVLMAGHILLYHPAVNAMVSAVTEGKIGSLERIRCLRFNPAQAAHEELSALWSLAPHDVALSLHLFQQAPRWVQATQNQAGEITLRVDFPHHRQAVLYVSTNAECRQRELLLEGTCGSLRFREDARPALQLNSQGDRTRETVWHSLSFDAEEPLLAEAKHFLRCLSTRETPRSGAEHSLNVTAVLQAAQKSLDQHGRPITLGLSTPNHLASDRLGI